MTPTRPLTALLVLWDLSGCRATMFDELRDYLRERSIPRFEALEGLRQKTWISSPTTGKWGALYLFDRRDQAQGVIDHLGESPVVALVGSLPTAELFDVEAVVEGRHSGLDLLVAGLARG